MLSIQIFSDLHQFLSKSFIRISWPFHQFHHDLNEYFLGILTQCGRLSRKFISMEKLLLLLFQKCVLGEYNRFCLPLHLKGKDNTSDTVVVMLHLLLRITKKVRLHLQSPTLAPCIMLWCIIQIHSKLHCARYYNTVLEYIWDTIKSNSF